MNEIVNKFLLHLMHLRLARFMDSVCGPITKNKERIQKFKERGDSHIFIKSN